MIKLYWNFFDYKYNIEGYNGQDYDGIMHLVYMLICLVLIPLLIRHLRRKDHAAITRLMKITAILLIIEEITKITWESYWDITMGYGFNFQGLLPLETCSLFIYTLTIAAFSKGKAREYALAWMSSIGVVGGISYILFTNCLKWYPFFSYGAFHSMIFHFMMVFMGLLITCSGYYRFTSADMNRGFVPQLIMAIPVIMLDYAFDWDYMLLHHAGGVPFIEKAGEVFALRHVPFMTTLLMLLLYYLMSRLFIMLSIGIQNNFVPHHHASKAAKKAEYPAY